MAKKNLILVVKPPGLINIGANCYLNSALQGISSCTKFVEDVKKLCEDYKNQLNKLNLFKELLLTLKDGNVSQLEISKHEVFKAWNKFGQQDSFEFLVHVINEVYTEIRKHNEINEKIKKRNIQEWLKINLPLRIKIQYRISCKCGNVVNVPLQSDLALHVTITHEKNFTEMTLQDLVTNYFKKDTIQDYICEKESCNYKTPERSVQLVGPLPKTICLHLQRTYFNGSKMVKLKEKIIFHDILSIPSEFVNEDKSQCDTFQGKLEIKDLDEKASQNNFKITIKKPLQTNNKQNSSKNSSKSSSNKKVISVLYNCNNNFISYCDSNENKNIQFNGTCSNSPSNNKTTKKNTKTKTPELKYIYNLRSVIEHSGSVSSGHYICYKYFNNKWYYTDDSSIKEVKESVVFDCEAYILFYESE